MNKIDAAIVHAFTYRERGGNPAGVVLDADELTPGQKLEIAAKIGLSETAFVSASTIANVKLEFFTPTKQIPHCGHATIATFSYLRDLGIIGTGKNSKETIDGLRDVIVYDDLVFMEQKAPTYFRLTNEDEALALKSLGISLDQLADELTMEIVNTGNSFLIVPLKDESVLRDLNVRQETIESLSKKYNLIGFYPFIRSTDSDFDAYSRMFAPFYGIDEESATGMAAGPLGCYLHDRLGLKKEVFNISQGKYMNPPAPSEIKVEIETDQSRIHKIFAGGSASMIKKLEIAI